jgi:hypothetical protein
VVCILCLPVTSSLCGSTCTSSWRERS